MAVDLRALLVAYAFPPVGGAGVQRALKLAKYLPSHGVTPSVLTVSNPSVPVTDETLERDFPEGMEILRARTFEPGYAVKQAAWTASAAKKPSLAKRAVKRAADVAKQLLVPDPQVLWQPAAQLALAKRLAGPSHDDVVVISGPPFSQFLLAPTARLRPGTAVVLDYRDEWSTYRSTYEMMGSRLAGWVGDPLEAALLRSAHAITTATEEFRKNLLERFTFVDPAKVTYIPNGYDPEDFPKDLPSPRSDRFVVTYAGTVFKLTSARGFLAAVKKLHAKNPELARLLEVRFIGRIVDTELDAFEGMEEFGVTRLGYVDHVTVVRELSASHRVLCLLDDVPNVERIYPAKIFELMFLARPVLTLAPEGALTRLVRAHALGPVLPPRDVDAIVRELEGALLAFRDGSNAPPPSTGSEGANGAKRGRVGSGIQRYDRRNTAGEFAEVLRKAVSRARGMTSP
ncbi:MAG: glycosyltransferase [Polyangiaceae bacterium]